MPWHPRKTCSRWVALWTRFTKLLNRKCCSSNDFVLAGKSQHSLFEKNSDFHQNDTEQRKVNA